MFGEGGCGSHHTRWLADCLYMFVKGLERLPAVHCPRSELCWGIPEAYHTFPLEKQPRERLQNTSLLSPKRQQKRQRSQVKALSKAVVSNRNPDP